MKEVYKRMCALSLDLRSQSKARGLFTEIRKLKGQYHAIFSNTSKIGKTLFG